MSPGINSGRRTETVADNPHVTKMTDVHSTDTTPPGGRTAASEGGSDMMACGMDGKGLKGLFLTGRLLRCATDPPVGLASAGNQSGRPNRSSSQYTRCAGLSCRHGADDVDNAGTAGGYTAIYPRTARRGGTTAPGLTSQRRTLPPSSGSSSGRCTVSKRYPLRRYLCTSIRKKARSSLWHAKSHAQHFWA
jgi:hypothetical protein